MNTRQKRLHKILCEAMNDIIGFQLNEDDTVAIRTAKNKIMQQLKTAIQKNALVKNGSKDSAWNANKESLEDVASRLGINLDFDQNEYNNKMNTSTLDEMTKAIQKAAMKLSKYVNSQGAVKFGDMKKDMPLEQYYYLLRMKDMIDRLSLSYLYDTKNAGVLKTADQRYGIKYNFDKNNNFTGIDASNFSLNNNFEANARKWANIGTRKESLKGKSEEEIQALYKRQILERYVEATYGMNVEMPVDAFTYGNQKLPSDTLVINFTSAHRCPAWNDCVVKYACYARGSEHGYKDLYKKNTRLNLMWEAGRRDDELMKDLFQMVRAYLVNYRKLTSLINKKGREDFKAQQQQQYLQQPNLFGEAKKPKYQNIKQKDIYENPLTQYADIFKEHRAEVLRATKVRLNEDGDFIGQWLLDAWDEFAGELKAIGVSTTAYTCRNLQYGRLKNIIINASSYAIGREQGEDGKAAKVISKYFYAIPAQAYDEYEETYDDDKGNLVGKPLLYTAKDDFGREQNYIHVHVLPLVNINTGKPTGGFYYKCPCERIDVSEKGNPLPFAKVKSGKNVGKIKINKSTGKPNYEKLNCFNCRMCYQDRDPNSINGYDGEGEIYIFVRLHGTFTDEFNNEIASKIREQYPNSQYGVPLNYYNLHKAKMQQNTVESKEVKKIVEDMMPNIAKDAKPMVNTAKEGIKHITRHAIGSMNARLSGLAKI